MRSRRREPLPTTSDCKATSGLQAFISKHTIPQGERLLDQMMAVHNRSDTSRSATDTA